MVWGHISELRNAAQWLDGGEVVITNGGAVPDEGADQVAFLDSLRARHVAGLIIGPRSPDLTEELLTRAREIDLAILRVPSEIPFVSISQFIASANGDTSSRRLATHVRILETARPRIAGEGDLVSLFAQLEKTAGYRFALMSPYGTSVFPELALPSDLEISNILKSEDTWPSIPGGYAVPVMAQGRRAAILVALEDGAKLGAGLTAVRHVCTVAALELYRLYIDRGLARRLGSELMHGALAGEMSPDRLQTGLSEHSLLPKDGPWTVAAVSAIDPSPSWDDELHHRLHDRNVRHLVVTGDRLLLLVEGGDFDLRAESADLQLHVGVSNGFDDLARLSVARREALWALQRAEVIKTAAIAAFPASGELSPWLPTDFAELDGLVQETLGPILDYDAEHNTSLLESLRVYFEHERALGKAAETLFIHKHTLAYRIRRIEELTGRKLSSVRGSAEIWMALSAHALLAERSGYR